MSFQFANNASAKLASAITSGAVSLVVVTGQGSIFPTPSGGAVYRCTLKSSTAEEIVEVTARSSDTFTIVRAKEGTTAVGFAAGDTLNLFLTKEVMEACFQRGEIDTDGTLAANSDAKLASQKAVKTAIAAAVAGLSWKQAVRAATTTNGTLASAFANGSAIDGVTLATGDRILLKDQSTASQNGIYIVAASGAPTRATDADSGAELVNASVYVSEGTTNADTQWTCTTNATITVGSTSLAFAQLATGGPPTGAAGGALTGTYPNPTLAIGITTLTDGATVTWTVTNKLEDMAQLTIAGARTLAISGASAGFRGALHITESGSSRSLALPSGSIVANTGAGAIALSGVSGGKQKWTVSYDGTNYWWEFGATYT